MLKMVDGTGIIGVDMICPLGVSTPQPPNYDKVEMEGTGMLVLPNSLDAPLERLELGGKTEQVTTTGAQLLKPKDGSYTVFGVSVDIANGEIKLSGTATSSGGRTIRLSEPFLLKAGTYSSEVDGKIDFILSKNSDNSYLVNLAVKNFNVNEDTEVYVGLNVMAQNTYNNKYHIMLNSGNIPLPYEPYTGGKPSPSPEYPQEIKNSGKWNEEKQKYEVDVKVTGKNLLDTYEKAEKDSEFYSVNDDGSLNQLKSDVRPYSDVPSTLFLKSGEYYFSLFNPGVTFKLYNAEADEVLTEIKEPKSILVNLRKDANIKYKVFSNGGSSKNVRVMVSKTKASEYEPYKEQSLTLTSDRPITKWDRLVEQGGQIGWLYGSYVGRLPKTGYSAAYKADGQTFYFRQVLKSPDVASKEQYFNLFKCGDKNTSKVMDVALITIDRNMLEIALDDISIDSSAKFEEYLHGLPDMEVVYQTQEYEFAPLQQSEQNAIRALKTYYPTTVITVDGGELDPDIKVTYRKEI